MIRRHHYPGNLYAVDMLKCRQDLLSYGALCILPGCYELVNINKDHPDEVMSDAFIQGLGIVGMDDIILVDDFDRVGDNSIVN